MHVSLLLLLLLVSLCLANSDHSNQRFLSCAAYKNVSMCEVSAKCDCEWCTNQAGVGLCFPSGEGPSGWICSLNPACQPSRDCSTPLHFAVIFEFIGIVTASLVFLLLIMWALFASDGQDLTASIKWLCFQEMIAIARRSEQTRKIEKLVEEEEETAEEPIQVEEEEFDAYEATMIGVRPPGVGAKHARFNTHRLIDSLPIYSFPSPYYYPISIADFYRDYPPYSRNRKQRCIRNWVIFAMLGSSWALFVLLPYSLRLAAASECVY
jgi:hypothetical protein